MNDKWTIDPCLVCKADAGSFISAIYAVAVDCGLFVAEAC